METSEQTAHEPANDGDCEKAALALLGYPSLDAPGNMTITDDIRTLIRQICGNGLGSTPQEIADKIKWLSHAYPQQRRALVRRQANCDEP